MSSSKVCERIYTCVPDFPPTVLTLGPLPTIIAHTSVILAHPIATTVVLTLGPNQ